MATLTEQVIQGIESDPRVFESAMAAMMDLLKREMELRDQIESHLREAGVRLPSGWIDWEEVIDYLRHRAETAIIRDELRRNRREAGRIPADELHEIESELEG